MGGKHSPETRAAKAAALVAQLKGIPIEEVKIELPVESVDDKIAEAEAVVQYYETRGENFRHINCRWCGELFAYKWDRFSIAFCSIICAQADLRQRGLDWNPMRGPGQRWGRTAPIVVSAEALLQVQSLLVSKNGQEVQILHKSE